MNESTTRGNSPTGPPRRWIGWAVAAGLLVAVFFAVRLLKEDDQITDPRYYRGPMYNKKGELIDLKTGRVIDRLAPRPPTAMTSPSGDGSRP